MRAGNVDMYCRDGPRAAGGQDWCGSSRSRLPTQPQVALAPDGRGKVGSHFRAPPLGPGVACCLLAWQVLNKKSPSGWGEPCAGQGGGIGWATRRGISAPSRVSEVAFARIGAGLSPAAHSARNPRPALMAKQAGTPDSLFVVAITTAHARTAVLSRGTHGHV